MIGRLSGKLVGKEPPLLWLDVGGVGYELEAPMSTFYRLPELGQALTVHTHLTVREDAHILFAFATPGEKSLFRELIKVSGVGPKIGLAVLSGVSADEFWDTVRAEDLGKLTRIPGIGKKTAERLVVELKDKAGRMALTVSSATAGEGALAQAVSALVNLGYKPAEAQRLCEAAHKAGDTAEHVIREALKRALR
ncbi:MAG TPA: Holliday junction branch migration protein RuvA [Candidatus Binatia bacterium]|nr:Holliday junction branch migration protein RuvA [Candidatus Binatia bacterium]